jgi:PST family polysaccharide transporter
MTLIKTSLLSSIAVFIRLLTLLGINKVLAIYVGPSGYAALGQFQNVIQMITTFASGAISTGVTKYTAQYNDDELQQQLVWRTAGTIALVGSLFSAMLIAIFNEQLAIWFLNDRQYAGVFQWFAATLVFFTFNTLLLAILNGKKEIKRYVAANVAGSVFAFIVTVIMTVLLGLYGALIALAVYQSLSFFITLLLCYKASWFRVSYLVGGIDKDTAINLGKYTAMALTSAACLPISYMLVRSHLGESLGWDVAGYWEAMSRLSAAYLMLVTSTLAVYYLPRLSELKEASEIKREIVQGYKIILPAAAFFGLIIYLLRDFIIGVLFSADFAPMEQLFAWQMAGDTLKIGGWILAYLLLGQGMTKAYIITEITFSACFVLLTMFFTNLVGMEGVSIAHAVNYLLYWFTLIIYVYWFYSRAQNSN